MAKLFVAEFDKIGKLSGRIGNEAQAPQMPPIAEQVAAIGGASVTLTNPFNTKTLMVRVHCDAICSIAVGDPATVVATVNNMRLAANQTETFCVVPGQSLAVISNT